MNELINLALRRNIFYPCNEIYSNSPAGFYDYGPIGLKIKNNIIEFWRKELLESFDALEIDGCQILPEPIFKASGHLDSFYDPVVKCSKCGLFYRVDKLLESKVEVGEKTDLNVLDNLIKEHNLKCEKCKSNFEKSFHFNMMFKLNVGVGANNLAYLRPEACQNIFLDFLRIYKGSRRNLPLAIAQIGKAFRNEISPRNGLLRTREFSQMDIEFFFDPEEINNFSLEEYYNLQIPVKLVNSKKEQEFFTLKELLDKKIFKYGVEAYCIAKNYAFFTKIGFLPKDIRYREVSPEDRAFYSLATWDLEVKSEDSWVELMANNYRTNHDLSGHQKESKTSLEVLSNEKKVLPHIFEMSMGTDRLFYCLLSNALSTLNDKSVLKLNSYIAPYNFAIFPLVNKDNIDKLAENLYENLRTKYKVIYDDKGSIGKRYARIDEIGIRYAITIDYDTKEKEILTIRDSWTTEQEKVSLKDLNKKIEELLKK
jgi:glycyl-tRNA synthetase